MAINSSLLDHDWRMEEGVLFYFFNTVQVEG